MSFVREHAPSILVSALSSAFGVALLQVTSNLAVLIKSDEAARSSETVTFILGFIAWVFIVIAIYVGTIVTSNTFATIIAGRTRTIALLRLIGASARSQRRAVAREGLAVGAIGSVAGAAIGILLGASVVRVAVATGFIPDLAFVYVDGGAALPVVAVVLTTWLASWVGSRRVLDVSPMQALGAAQELSREQAARRKGRNRAALALMIVGGGLLALGIAIGLVHPLGVPVAVAGGILSFTGLVLGSQLVMPPALRLVGRMLGSSPAARLAAENAVRYPERSSRTTIGLVIGVTLVTMFAVAVASFQKIIADAQAAQPEVYQGTDEILVVVVVIFSVLIGFSALIAAVGLVNNLSLSVLQRTRELGLLRALGFTARQLRSMIRAEAAQLTVAAILVGLVLGTVYGWAGAQSLLGGIQGSPGIIVPVLPLWLLVAVVIAASVLTLVASVAPTRRATRITPVVALAVD